MITIIKIIFCALLFFASIVHAETKFFQENIVHAQNQKISLNFQDVKVRAALQLFSEFSGLNIIVSDKIQNNMTLHLENVSWQQALDIILQTQNLGKRQYENVLLVAPEEEIAAHEKQQLQQQQQIADLEPLHSELISINYGKAADIANLLKTQNNSLLSKRGNVNVDARTNTVWVQDVSTRLNDVHKLVKKLDVPVKQVLIEARIVNVDTSFEQELGVRFGITHPSNTSGTLEGANQVVGEKALSSIPVAQRLNVDLPAAGIGAAEGAASLGVALARLGSNTLLDLELSAMESEGSGQIISRPKLITANQQTATIEAGEEIPYQHETSSGATSVTFKKAVLSLNVTPQITPDGKVLMMLKVNQDKTGARLVRGVPSIDTREIQTQVLVNNGETIVLGGIYEERQNKQVERVPFLGSLPIVGALFRHDKTDNDRKELLIFVTPRILMQ